MLSFYFFLLLIHWSAPHTNITDGKNDAKGIGKKKSIEWERFEYEWKTCLAKGTSLRPFYVVVIVVAFHFVYPSINRNRWLNLVYKSHQDPFILLITATNKLNKIVCTLQCHTKCTSWTEFVTSFNEIEAIFFHMGYSHGFIVDKDVIACMPLYFRKVSALFSCIYLFHRQFYFKYTKWIVKEIACVLTITTHIFNRGYLIKICIMCVTYCNFMTPFI